MSSNIMNEFYNKMDIKIPNQFISIHQNRDFQYTGRNISLSPKVKPNNKLNLTNFLNLSNFSQNVRNRWTDNKNLGESFEIKGTLSRKNSKQIKGSTRGDWENLLNKSVDNIRPGKRIVKLEAFDLVQKNTQPSSRNTSYELAEFGRACKKKTEFPEIKKSTAIGSIGNFISLLPSYSVRAKKYNHHHHHHLNHTNIFSSDFRMKQPDSRQIRTKINLTKLTREEKVAGIPSSYKVNSYHNNYKVNMTYTILAEKRNTQGDTKMKFSKKISNKTNSSTIFSTDVSSSRQSARKTFFNNEDYKKFFNKNFGD